MKMVATVILRNLLLAHIKSMTVKPLPAGLPYVKIDDI